MDNAVALVQAYLYVNGYFTVAEYPVLEALKHAGYRTVTDIDILAFRFPGWFVGLRSVLSYQTFFPFYGAWSEGYGHQLSARIRNF